MKILCSLTLILFHSVLLAQENQKEVKNDIGFNSNIILNNIFSTSGTPFNFMYKRQTASTHAMRYGIVFNASISSQSGSNPNLVNSNSYSASPSIGKEWQHSAGKKWIWYCGADIRFNISSIYSKSNNNNLPVFEGQTDRYGASFVPFLGLRFAVSEKLYLATEANLNIGYTHQNDKSTTYDITGTPVITRNFTTNSANANTGSAVGIFVFYRF